MDMQLDYHSQAILPGIVSSSSTDCDARHHYDSLSSLVQHPRQEYSVPGKEPSAPNLRRFTGPLTHPTPSLTAQNITSFNHQIPIIHIPDLTRLITRPYSYYSVSGGAYGDIYKCVYHGPDGDVEVAVKAIRPQFIDDKVFRRELGIWKRLRHPNILELMGTTRRFSQSVALVAPWIVNGNLTSFLSQNETLGLRDRLLLLRDIAAGLNYLHTFSFTVDGHTYFNPVIHGDLTGSNVLIGSDRTAFLADFGLSGTLTQLPGVTYLAMSRYRPGALRWAAPELFSAEESAPAVTTRSDIYSFGSIALQVLTGNIPWPHLINPTAILRKMIFEETHPRPDNHVTDRHWNFITSCWSKTPTNRPSAKEALQFIDCELGLYNRGSANVGQHSALVPIPGYTPPVIGPRQENVPPLKSSLKCFTCIIS
ncbi:kinase-like domain-containing protein [Suillus americanus]|nr:kinase-like domain-containing protein [Suillus americanus]